MGIEVIEKANIIDAEGETKVDVEEDSNITLQCKIMISLEETAKVKELEKISVDTKEIDNINDKMEVANVNESTKTKVIDQDMIITDEAISIDNKDEIRTDVEGDSNINIKPRTENMIHKGDTSAIVDIKNVSKISTEEYFETASNQTANVLSFSIYSIAIIQLQYIKVDIDESDVNLKDGIKIFKVLKSTLRRKVKLQKNT